VDKFCTTHAKNSELENKPDFCIVINGIHAKSGGGVTYLRHILPILAKFRDTDIHLFIHKNQFDLFYPIDERINVTLLSFNPNIFNTLLWEQIAIPLKAWAMGCSVLFSPANYGPILARNHVILLRNAISVIAIAQNPRQIIYWMGMALATLASFLSAKRVIAVSNYAQKLMSFKLPKIFTKKCEVVHHGVKQISISEKQNGCLGTDLLAVSDIYVQKNYYKLIQSFAKIVEKRSGLRLIIIGERIDQSYAKKLDNLIEKLGIEEQVVFKGKVNTLEVMECYKNCRVFVFPSLVETFGNTLLEAMIVGVPIACSKSAAMPEVLGDCGVFFDPDDEFDIADKVETLLDNEELSIELAQKASDRAAHFRWEKTVKQTFSILMDAANKNQNVKCKIR